MSQPRVTLQDVADEAGLSKAAASYALRGLKGSSDTQERVREVADRLGYTAHPAAQALAGGRTGSIGIYGSLTDLWQQQLAVRLAARLREAGLSSSLADTGAQPETERAVVAEMAHQQADGVICLATDPTASWWADLPEDFVVVSIGEVLSQRPAAASVVFANEVAVRTGLEHLVGLGHKVITFLTTASPMTPGRPAVRVAKQFATDHGLKLSVITAPPSPRQVAPVVEKLLASAERPTAIFCLSDTLAFGAYLAAENAGLTVPQDLSILGFDDHDLAEMVHPPLTTFGWDEDAILDAALELLLAALAGEPTQSVAFTPEFLLRGSTAPAG